MYEFISNLSLISVLPLAAFLVLLIMQSLWPRRQLADTGWGRSVQNLLLFAVNLVVLRILVPLTLVGVSIWAAEQNIGLFNLLAAPGWLMVLVCVVVLDCMIYWQHVATHRWTLLWRMHKVHHADRNMDVTTAVRFHPIELVLSLMYKSLGVILLGAPVLAVVVFELLLFIGPAFNHSNLRLPATLDRGLRWVIVTPDTHRAHHSTSIAEQNTNYGFFLIWWDKLFNTYTQTPRAGHEHMPIGLTAPQDQCDRVDQMLLAPFR